MSKLAEAAKALADRTSIPPSFSYEIAAQRQQPAPTVTTTAAPTTGILPPQPRPTTLDPVGNNNEAIRLRIKELRVAKGWSQRDLAAQSGMSQGTITRAERHMEISLWCLLKITEALGHKLTLIMK